MTARLLRARALLAEADVLGVDLGDLVAADTERHRRLVTVSDWVAAVEETFGSRTAATYRPYWRLAVAQLGDTCMAPPSR